MLFVRVNVSTTTGETAKRAFRRQQRGARHLVVEDSRDAVDRPVVLFEMLRLSNPGWDKRRRKEKRNWRFAVRPQATT